MLLTNKAIVTIAIGAEYSRLAKWTHPAMRSYAQRVGAEFIVIDSFATSSSTPHFAKYRLYELLTTYQRVLYIDSDALIASNCPDLFEMVPESQLGVFLEEDEPKPTRRITEIQNICGNIDGWTGTFFNTGVMVLSAAQRGMFDPAFQQNSVGSEYEQAQLNWNAQKLGLSIFNIGRRFNHIVWELDGSRYDSCIIHYVFCCPPKWLSRSQKIALDRLILSAPPPIRSLLITARCAADRVLTELLKWTLPVRGIFGLYNKGGGKSHSERLGDPY